MTSNNIIILFYPFLFNSTSQTVNGAIFLAVFIYIILFLFLAMQPVVIFCNTTVYYQ